MAGKLDQGGGPVWRYKDAGNYYIARMNPLEDNFRVYKVVAGKRTQLSSVDIKVPAGGWHTIRVVHKADHIECYLDGKLHLDVKDDTFPGSPAKSASGPRPTPRRTLATWKSKSRGRHCGAENHVQRS